MFVELFVLVFVFNLLVGIRMRICFACCLVVCQDCLLVVTVVGCLVVCFVVFACLCLFVVLYSQDSGFGFVMCCFVLFW